MAKHTKLASSERVEAAIILNERYLNTPQYKEVIDLANELGVEKGTIYTIRYRLGKRGIIQTSKVSVTGARNQRLDPHVVEGQLAALIDEPIVTPLDRLKILSRIIRTGALPLKIQAIKALEDLTKSTEGRIGPPEPLTEELRVHRLARLLMAVGEETAISAMEVAFSHAPIPSSSEIPEPENAVPDNSTPIPDAPPPVSGTLPDLQPTDQSSC